MRRRIALPLVFTLLIAWTAHAFQATPVRVADAQCQKCHKEIFERYLATPMARASGAAEENFIPGTFRHAPSGVEYSISNARGLPYLSFRSGKHPDIAGEYRLSYFLGSGHLGTTYLYELNHYLFESPVAWYASSHGYDMKPGLAEMTQMPPSLPMQSGCLRCHMSAVAAQRSWNHQSIQRIAVSTWRYHLRGLSWGRAASCEQRRQSAHCESGASRSGSPRFCLHQLSS